MKEEYEVIEHSQIADLKVFLVEMTYRSPHMHKEFEICMVLSGTIVIYVNQGNRSYSKGDLVIFNPRQTHEIHAVTENSIILSVQFSSGFCKRIYPQINQLEFEDILIMRNSKENTDELQYFRNILLKLAMTYLRKEKSYEFLCMANLYEVFAILLNIQPWHLISDKEKTERYNKGKRMNRIIDYVESHFTEKVLLADICEMENLSLYYLSHFFKEMLGMSFQQYVALMRFERARKMVEQTNRSITEICMECGFSDYRYLNKIYKQQLGYTPIDYRNSHVIISNEEKIEKVINTERFFSVQDSLLILEMVENGEVFRR